MNDTPSEMEERYRRMLMERSGEDRLKMGCSMHATTQALLRAGVLNSNPRASAAELRRALFRGFYGRDFDPDTGDNPVGLGAGWRT